MRQEKRGGKKATWKAICDESCKDYMIVRFESSFPFPFHFHQSERASEVR